MLCQHSASSGPKTDSFVPHTLAPPLRSRTAFPPTTTTMDSVAQRFEHLVARWSAIDSVVLATAAAIFGCLLYFQFNSNAIPTYSQYFPYLTQWQFFESRADLTTKAFKKFKGSIFKLKVIGYPVIVTRSHQARAFFFGDKNLSFTEGYKILLGGAPRLEDIKIEGEHIGTDNVSWFSSRITHLLRKERLGDMLPVFIADMDHQINQWSDEGTMDPFVDIYNVIFQLTARAALCDEIADDPKLIARVRVLYEKIERAADAKSFIFPWLPNAAIREKNDALKELYALLSDVVEKKKKRGTVHLDTIQTLMDLGDGTSDIVGFALGTLFAGVLNTTNIACWIPLFLDANPEWKAKAKAEINTFLDKNSIGNDPVAARMMQASAEAWEEQLPVLDTIIRETIRLVVTGSAMRRNIEKDVKIDGKVIERGAFLLYPLAELHYDPEIYKDPYNFDPGRFDDGREEDKKVHFGYLGWGVGRHPCLGMRFAKLELKLLTVYLLAAFDFLHVDDKGTQKKADGHSINRNLVFQVFPKDKNTFLNYRRVVS